MKTLTLLILASLLGSSWSTQAENIYLTLSYDWSCDGSYGHSAPGALVLKDDGTFDSASGTYTGNWQEVNNTLTWRYSSGTVYSGYHSGKAVVGTMMNHNNSNGCFYAMIEDQAPLENIEVSTETGTR